MQPTILEQIKLGYSESRFNDRSIYFSHFNLVDLEKIRENYDSYLQECISNGVPTESEKLAEAEECGIWTEADESKISEIQERITNIKLSRSRVFLKKQIALADEKIKKNEEELKPLLQKRQFLLFNSAEYFAQKWNNEYYLFLSCRADQECRIPFFDQETFEELDDGQLEELGTAFNSSIGRITIDKIKKIAINPLFLNMYMLCDSVVDLFGGNIIDMTFFQSQLIRFAKEFKGIFEAFPNIPERVQSDPDQLIEWAIAQANFRKTGKSANSIVGMTNEDRANLGVEKPRVSPLAELRKKGQMNLTESAQFFGK